jgi:hypothetical protein
MKGHQKGPDRPAHLAGKLDYALCTHCADTSQAGKSPAAPAKSPSARIVRGWVRNAHMPVIHLEVKSLNILRKWQVDEESHWLSS